MKLERLESSSRSFTFGCPVGHQCGASLSATLPSLVELARLYLSRFDGGSFSLLCPGQPTTCSLRDGGLVSSQASAVRVARVSSSKIRCLIAPMRLSC